MKATTSYQVKNPKLFIAAGALVLSVLAVPITYAATNYDSKLTQAITAGTISTDVRTAAGVVVASPSFGMTSVNISNSQQTSTGTFGDSAQRITVDNPGGANSGWTLALQATVPTTGKWVSGANNYDYKGAASAGQLTINPATGTITPVTGGITGVTKGTSASFSGVGSPITLMQAGGTASTIWNGYMTGVGLSQTIPASQPGGTYSIDMTQTVTAL